MQVIVRLFLVNLMMTGAYADLDNDESFFPNLPDIPVSQDPSEDQFVLITTYDNGNATEESLIEGDVTGEPLSDADYLEIFDEEFWRDSFNITQNENYQIEGDLFEGDIAGVRLISRTDLDDLNVTIKNAITNTYQKWPAGFIPYTISGVFNTYERGMIYKAMKEFSAKSCITWIPRDPARHSDFVHILKDRGCYSKVGRIRGAQVLSLGDGCFDLGTVVHEMLHATGFWHEQSRPDRDEFVKVSWENIMPGMEDNFARYSRAEVSTLSLPYDTSSVMHYTSRAFSKNGRNTIEPKVLSLLPFMGQRNGFTNSDLKKLNTLYECKDKIEQVTLKPVTTSSCNDAYPNGLCYTWSKNDQGCSRYPSFMSKYCPKTCGICSLPTATQKCEDRDARCPAWAAYQDQCISNRQFMIRMCPKTCGICEIVMKEQEVILSNIFGIRSGANINSHPGAIFPLILFSSLLIFIKNHSNKL